MLIGLSKHLVKKILRLILRFSIFTLGILAIITCTILFSVLETTPQHVPSRVITAHEAKVATKFAHRVSKKIINSKDPVTVSGSEGELNSAILLANRTYPGIYGNVKIQDEFASFAVSVRTRILGKDFYLNFFADLVPSTERISWQNGRVGKLQLSNNMSTRLFDKIVELMVGKQYARKLLKGISLVNTNQKTLTMTFHPPKGFHEGFANAVLRISNYTGQQVQFDSSRVQHYLDFLVDMTRALPKQNISLSFYLESLMKEARQQSRRNPLTPDQENLSAIFALAIQAAPGVFRYFISGLKVGRLNATYQPLLTLSNRHDLAKHFLYSAALHILAKKGVSFSLGEAKEFMDSDFGGSGFSFADIAADRAGVRFAEIATASPDNATVLQEFCAAGLKESHFFPSINGLPEGLNEQEFHAKFNAITSLKYREMLSEIDRRLLTTPVLGIHPE